MPVVETVLRSAAPASLDFTLHDDQHGFRVAETGYELISEGADGLSAIELSMLLLASYCHDIGMSPRRDKVKNHYDWLLTAERNLLSSVEQNQFQSWLDTNRSGITAPVEVNRVSLSGIKIADEAIAYYARSKHNDWSEEFIRDQVADLNVSLYAGWIHDLVTLCRSHHEGLVQLRQDKFSTKYVGSPASPVNLRYLAAILRVSDILEFAPERTPSVILRNRNIAPSSRIYWYKDHSISFNIDHASKRLFFSAQTPNAAIHKAVLQTAEWVDNELALAATLQQENLFASGVISEAHRSSYDWPWPSRLVSDIREIPGRFTYIDGSFRPDTQKLLATLSGTALYESNLSAVRELIQNALDAVREQIAYTRLQFTDPMEPNAIQSLANLHHVTVSLTKDGDRIFLKCEDNGTGMTRAIIERHLLISGSGIRGESRRLERAAQERGFAVERTGRFGIGVLSYFMLADSLSISTRRSQEAGDPDVASWQFTISGVDGFGELTSDSRSSRGTSVTLELKPEVIGKDANHFYSKLEEYIRSTFRWLPCRLVLRREFDKVSQIHIGPGWAEEANSHDNYLTFSMFEEGAIGDSLLIREEVALQSDVIRFKEAMIAQSRATINWTPAQERQLPDGKGVLRCSIPSFDFFGHNSNIFVESIDNNLEFLWREHCFKHPTIDNRTSLHGISVDNLIRIDDCLFDLDLRSHFAVMADRSKIIGKLDTDTFQFMKSFRIDAWLNFLNDHNQSLFNELNVAYAFIPPSRMQQVLREQPAWVVRPFGSKLARCALLDQPIISVGRLSFHTWANQHMKMMDDRAEAMPVYLDDESLNFALHHLYCGGRLVVQSGSMTRQMLGVTWDSISDMRMINDKVSGNTTTFPSDLSHLFCALLPGKTLFNADHEFTKRSSSYNNHSSHSSHLNDVIKHLEAGSRSAEDAIKFVVNAAQWSERPWQWMQENKQDELRAIFTLAQIDDVPLGVIDCSKYNEDASIVRLDRAAYSKKEITEECPTIDEHSTFASVERNGPR
ncbi:HD domain-containing protein [Sphingomonas sp. 22176]|uniref:HD domain-containing protein n=1 Tax=Sphingomonas sp. 22176 TaxID=3453884 RepID=UPI003F856B5B